MPGAGALVQHAGAQADLASWHREIDPVNRFGMVLMNSSGAPAMFVIRGGAGRPSDLPRGIPSAVAMIHSFSAADPTDPQTIAGRWLAQGAFVYFGAVNEPYLAAFRTPRLVAALMAEGVPFVAALRQGEFEPFGFPWRFVYLGDPLYRIRAKVTTQDQGRADDEDQPHRDSRIMASEWRTIAPEYSDWSVTEITAPAAGPNRSAQPRVFALEDDRLRWCLDAAIGDLVGPSPRVSLPSSAISAGVHPSNLPVDDWHAVLQEIRRDRLDPDLRPVLDDLLIDTLGEAGAFDELMMRLAQIPSNERGPRVWQAIETCGMAQLARLARQGATAAGFHRALDLWDRLIRLNWPKSSQFPAHFTERLAALAGVDEHRRQLWLDRLREAGDAMAAEPRRYPHATVLAAERARVEAQLVQAGSGH
jgi:hypothetical protein